MIGRARDDDGAITILAALSVMLVIISAAFAVDLGREVVRGRDMRTVADVAALDKASAA